MSDIPEIQEEEVNPLVEAIVKDIENLPTLPTIITRLLELIEDPESSIKDLQDVISMDLALTAKVLKLSNSAYYGYPREISTLTQAVIILGLNTIKSLVLAASAYNVFYKELPGYQFAAGGMWFHSFLTASFARMVAKKKVPAQQESAFIAGLLHDMGKQVMSKYVEREYTKIMAIVQEEKVDFAEAEREILGFDHCQVGGQVAFKWRLPEAFEAVMQMHHQPIPTSEHFALGSICHIADYLAWKIVKNNPLEYFPPLKKTLLKRAGYEASDILELEKMGKKQYPDLEATYHLLKAD